jgi:hypothetical protein
MQFIHDGTFHTVARITGPAHNILSLRLVANGEQAVPVVEQLKTVHNPSLDSQSVVTEAHAGVNEANLRFGSSYRIAALKYASDDTPPESVYRMLAFSLVERLAKGVPFVEVRRIP